MEILLLFLVLPTLSIAFWLGFSYAVTFGVFVIAKSSLLKPKKRIYMLCWPIAAFFILYISGSFYPLFTHFIPSRFEVIGWVPRLNNLINYGLCAAIAVAMVCIVLGRMIGRKPDVWIVGRHIVGSFLFIFIMLIFMKNIEPYMGASSNSAWALLTHINFGSYRQPYGMGEIIGRLVAMPLAHWFCVATYYLPSSLPKSSGRDNLAAMETQ